ncbi:hypothetical protein R6Q57_013041 [Mikania cordata]
MEIFEAKKMTDETLSGVTDDSHTILKPSLEETVGDDSGSLVVKTIFTEKTQISVVKTIQDNKGDEFMKNQEQEKGDEVMMDEKEGRFVNQNDNDDGLNVNCSDNNNVVGSLAGESASGLNLVFEANAGSKADECGENASRVPMDINLSVEEDKKDENGTEIFESKDEMNKNCEENVGSREDIASELAESKIEFSGEQGETEEGEDHGFVAGDLVWGKIKGHTWWPGQIYNPSDASDNAARSKRKGGLLVAYFGDGSFSWCSPSHLKPFIDHFPEMLNKSDSKKSASAVQTALEEVSRLVEAGLMCNCQTVNRVNSPRVVNRGIKKGVLVPKGNTIKALINRMEPVKLLLILKTSAMDPGARLSELELTILKSCFNVFYRKKSSYLLVEYHDLKCIEGLEDTMRNGVMAVADSDINDPLGSIDNGDDKMYQTRKQKSVAELLKDEPKIKKLKTPKDGGSGKRKRKALVVLVTPESGYESGGGGGIEEETMSPRQRKKSKYLSPPYLSPIGGGRLSVFGSGSCPGSGLFKEPKPEPEKAPEMDAKLLEDSLKKGSGKKTRQTRGAHIGSDSQEEQNKPINAAVNVKKVLHGLLSVARDPTSFKDKNVPVVTDFILSYRNAIFGEASSYQTDQRKNDQGTSDVAFIKRKLESMIEIVQRCDETEMSAQVKASLEGGIQEVLQKVGKMMGK